MRLDSSVMRALLFLVLVPSTALATHLPPSETKKTAPSKKDITKVKVRRIEQIVPTSTTAPPPKNAVVGKHNIVVVLVELDDAKFKENPKSTVERFFFDKENPSVANYYQEQSYGQYLLGGKVFGPVKVKGTAASFSYGPGKDGAQVRKLIAQAFDAVKDDIDMKVFDGYNAFSEEKPDGAVDHFAVIMPVTLPGSEGWFKPVWPHRGTFEYGDASKSPAGGTTKKLKSYYVFGFPQPLGTFVHEHGHDIGLPDLYDRDDTSHGAGPWCLMASGSWLGRGDMPGHISAYGKVAMGWVRPRILARSTGRIEIPAVETSPTVIKIPVKDAESPEYFLVENRQRIGYDAHIPDEGLLVWHIDTSVKSNDDEDHKLVDVVEPAAVQDLDRTLRDQDPDLLDTFRAGKKSRFADDTTPSAMDYAGKPSGIVIDDISPSKSVMTASFNVPTIVIPEGEPYTAVRDNYTYGQFGAVPLPVGSENFMPLVASEGAFDVNEIEMLVMARPRQKSRMTITLYEDQNGQPGKIRAKQEAEAVLKDDSYAWQKFRLKEKVRFAGNQKFWVGMAPLDEQLALAYNPASLSKEARFRQKGSKDLKDAYNFAKGKEPAADFIIRAKGYGYIGVQNPKIPAQADESDELIKRMREADAQLDKKQFLEAAATYNTVLQRMSEDPKRFMTWIPVVVNALGVADYQAKNWKGAIDNFTRSLRYAQMMGDPRAEADVLENIGETHFHSGNLALAQQFCERAQKMNHDVPDRLLESEYWLGRIAMAKRDESTAKEHLDQALELAQTVHKAEPKVAEKWAARIDRARAGTATGEDAIDGESRIASELKEEHKAEAAPESVEEDPSQRKIDLSDYGFGP